MVKTLWTQTCETIATKQEHLFSWAALDTVAVTKRDAKSFESFAFGCHRWKVLEVTARGILARRARQ